VDAHADGEGKEKVSLKQTTSQASTPPALLEGEPLVLSDFYKKCATKAFSTDLKGLLLRSFFVYSAAFCKS
jgi:hypothetical protein